jgi:PAS domain S-box-containing protein
MNQDKISKKNFRDIGNKKNPNTSAIVRQEDYKLLFDNSPLGVCIADSKGNILEINEALTEILGFRSPEEAKKINLLRFKPFIENGFVRLFSNCFEQAKTSNTEMEYISMEGKEHFLHVRMVSLEAETEVPGKIFIIAGDITKRVKTKKILEKNEERFRKFFKTSPDAVTISRVGDGKYIEVNEIFTAISGYTKQETIGKSSIELNIWADPEDRKRLVKELKEQGIVKNFSTRLRMKNGQIIHAQISVNIIDINGTPHLLSVIRNIEDAIKTREALRLSELKFRKAFKISPDAININRKKDGMYVDINEGFTSITGYTQEEIEGKTAFEIDIWADKKDREHIFNILNKKGFIKDYPARFRMKNGNIIHGLLSANIIDINGVPHVLFVTRDIEETVKANNALRQSELKFRKAFTISPNALAITHLETGRYLDVNEGFLEETGYTREEIIGKTAQELRIWADYRQRKKLQQILKEKGFAKDMPINLRMKDGTIVRGMVSANFIEINGEPHLISITRNVEDFMKATEDFRQSEQRYKTLFSLSPAGIMLIDETGTILEANPAYCRNIGYTIQEIIGEKIWKIANNPIQEKMEQILGYIPTIPENKIAEKEVVNIKKDGNPIFLHLYETRIRLENNKSAILSTSVDVTKEKHYQEELIRQTKRLKEAQNIGRLGSWELNWKTKELYWSDGIYHLLELNREQIPNYSLFQQLIHPDDVQTARKILKDSVKTGNSFKYIHRLLLGNGKIKWVIERGKSFYSDKGKLIRTHGTVQDITRLKQAEDKLKELNELLEEKVRDRTIKLKKKQQDLSKLLNDMQMIQQKLRNTNKVLQNLNHELEAFSYSVSHDLKAPLRAIHGFTNILKEDYYPNLGEAGKTLTDDILSETKQMGEIIDALLQLSRTGRKNLNFVEFDLAPLAQSIFTEQQKHYNLPHSRFVVHELSTVFADYNLIKQLIANLLSNALKYSANVPDPLVEIGESSDEKINETIFYVKDNGVGFNEESAGRMFDAFSRLHSKKEFEGTGIGLAIAKRIVIRHGGKIWAKSQPGNGTTLFFTLPETDKQEKS